MFVWSSNPIDTSLFKGLSPQACMVLGSGLSREEVKETLIFELGAIRSDVLLSVSELCLKILGWDTASGTKRLLSSGARQEGLRLLLSQHEILTRFPELKRLKRQAGFFQKLDRAIDQGRYCFVTFEEAALQEEMLVRRLGQSPLRVEMQLLRQALEAWMEGIGKYDEPALISLAIERLEAGMGGRGHALKSGLPPRIVRIKTGPEEALEVAFWQACARHVEVSLHEPIADAAPHASLKFESWHTLDDGAQAISERVSTDARTTVILPDESGARRSLERALVERKIPLLDPRDPRFARREEMIKRLMTPLRMVALGYPVREVLAYTQSLDPAQLPEQLSIPLELSRMGFRQGRDGLLSPNAGEGLRSVQPFIRAMDQALSGKLRFFELKERYLSGVREHRFGPLLGEPKQQEMALGFMERVFEMLQADLSEVGLGERRAPLRYWLERLDVRVREGRPFVERKRPPVGISVSKLSQFPVGEKEETWFYGLTPYDFERAPFSEYWYSERDRELLQGEFPIVTASALRQSLLASVHAWIRASKRVVFVEATFDWDGGEREGLSPVYRLLFGREVEFAVEARGAHPRSHGSYLPLSGIPETRSVLPPLWQIGRTEITATELDQYSRCAFRGTAYGRWKLFDDREAESDLWPDVKGILLHAAIQLLIEREFSITEEEALETVWAKKPPRGLIRGERVTKLVKNQLIEVLKRFRQEEEAYRSRAQVEIFQVEGPELKFAIADEERTVLLKGIPDRIDRHESGYFVLDYKTSSTVPKGKWMVEDRYRLQLPFYAVALREQLKAPLLGVQFVELTRRGGRSNGVFFKPFNGKHEGALTHLKGGRSSSLFDLKPDQLDVFWDQVKDQVTSEALAYARGVATVLPKREEDCRTCSYIDLCGKSRIADLDPDLDFGEAE